MTLDEAIKHCNDKAKELRAEAYKYKNDILNAFETADCLECASEHEQLAEWLTELKARREADSNNVAEWVEEDPTTDDKEMGFDLRIVCSHCRFPNSHYEYDENHNPKSVVYVRTRYCPECGKRMIRDFNGQETK